MNQNEPSGLKFLLIRAGSTEFDEHGRILGSLDIPLSKQGEAEIHQTARQLIGIPVVAVYSAACQAAQQSAVLIGKSLNLKPTIETKLTNLDCGLWHGKSLEELRETQPTLFKQWKEHPELICPPGGEMVASAMQRVKGSLQKIRRKVKSGVVVFVAPDPLCCLIRRELQPQPEQREATEKQPKLKCGEWALIDTTTLPV